MCQPYIQHRYLLYYHQPTLCVVCVCVCFLPIYSGHQVRWTYQPPGITQEEGHTEFPTHLPSAVRASFFLARRVQPFLSLVDREVEFLCTNGLLMVLHLLGIFCFLFFSEKNPVYEIELTPQRVRKLRGYF